MKRRRFVAILAGLAAATLDASSDAWQTWSAKEAEAIGRAAYQQGRVGGIFDLRVLKTERSYNYKLAATWLSPDVVRATARLEQLRRRLSAEAATRLVTEAEAAAHTVLLVEIDPREGAGVIPLDWLALLQFEGGQPITGTSNPALREQPSLAGVLRRNYDYDRFWVTFALVDDAGRPLVPPDASTATLTVRIHDKEGRVTWTVPPAVHQRVATLARPR